MASHWRKKAANHLANILRSCIAHKSQLTGKAAHANIIRSGFSDDVFLSNRLVELYSRCGLPRQASDVFDRMPCRNVYSWNSALSLHCKAGNLGAALKMFEQMPERNAVSWNTVISAAARTSGSEKVGLYLYDMMVRERESLPTHVTFASVLSACGNAAELARGRTCHGLAVKLGLDGNPFVENALVSMYTKCGCVDEAYATFHSMRCPSEISFTAMMGGLAQCGSTVEAYRLFVKMHADGVPIDHVAVSAVLNACARHGEEKAAGASCGEGEFHGFAWFSQSIHAFLIKLGFDSDAHVGNSLIDMYMKCGQTEKAELAFQTLPTINVVSWNALMAGYGQAGCSAKALDLLQQMQLLGFEPDDVTYVSQLTSCVKSGDLETAHQIFLKISHPGVSVWNTILSGYCQGEDHGRTIDLFRTMQFSGVLPDRTSLAVMLRSCSGLVLPELGKQIHAASTRLNLQVDVFVGSALVDMYSKCGRVEEARVVFERMPERDVVSWNSMISGLAVQSLTKEAFGFFREMRGKGVRPTGYSYASVVSSCARLASSAEGREAHALVEKDGHAADVFVGTALIDFYAKCGNVEDAWRFFDRMPTKNVVSWNEIIHGYAQNGRGEMAVKLYKDMLGQGEKPDSVTFIAALTACSHSGLVDEGLVIFDSMEKVHGVKPVADHYTCMIDALGRAGRFGEIEDLIGRMPFKDDAITWEVLLSSCRLHGNVGLGKLAAEHLFRLDPCSSSPYVLLSNMYAQSGRWGDASAVRRLMRDRGVVKDCGFSWVGDRGAHAFMVDDDFNRQDSPMDN